jgi:hypothetical protein
MHPYISQAIAAERAADAIRVADASRRAREARQVVAAARANQARQSRESRESRRARRARGAVRRQPCAAGLTVSGPQCR